MSKRWRLLFSSVLPLIWGVFRESGEVCCAGSAATASPCFSFVPTCWLLSQRRISSYCPSHSRLPSPLSGMWAPQGHQNKRPAWVRACTPCYSGTNLILRILLIYEIQISSCYFSTPLALLDSFPWSEAQFPRSRSPAPPAARSSSRWWRQPHAVPSSCTQQ